MAMACRQQGALLLELYDLEGASSVLDRGLAAAERDGAELHHLPCLALAAEAAWRLGDESRAAALLERADEIIDRSNTPTGSAFLLGADAHVATATVALLRGDVDGAERRALRLLDEARTAGWMEAAARAAILVGRCAVARGDREEAQALFVLAADVAGRASLSGPSWQAHAWHAGVLRRQGRG